MRTAGMNRRGFLTAGAGLGAAATIPGVAGCGDDSEQGGGVDPDELEFNIPDAQGNFPAEDVTVRIVDSNDTKVPYWEAFFDAYEAKHSNVTIEYDGLPWNRIEEVIPLGIRNDTAHDLMQLPSTIPLTQAVGEGWVAPLDDVIPNVEEWKQNFPQTVQVEGVQVFDGKLYSVPLATEQRYLVALHYNEQLMTDAGYDPQSEPLTWDEYRDAARKITQQGDGQVYGVVLEINQPDRLSLWVEYAARMAGLEAVGTPGGGDHIDQSNGEFFHTRDEIVEAIELLLALQQDGSILPGSNSLTAPESWPRVLRGNAGMVTAGPWVTVQWETDDPNFEFGVASHPIPQADHLPAGYPTLGADVMSMFAKSNVKQVAGDILGYVTSEEGQNQWGRITGVGNPPILQSAREASAEHYSPQARKCQELANAMVANPEPVIANPDVSLVEREEKPVTPSLGEVIQAVLVGEVDDIRAELRDLKDRSERNRDEAIEAAKAQGGTVTREDWLFSNWDPTQDYLTEDYDGR